MLPEVKETSLSLSFDEQASAKHSEQGYANQQILPHPKRHMQQTQPQNQPRLQHDQENDHTNLQEDSAAGLINRKEQLLKQVSNKHAPPNSPSRTPLKQILAPNQTHARVSSQKQNHLPQKLHQEQRTAAQVPDRRGNSPSHNSQERLQKVFSDHSTVRPKGNVKQASVKGPNAFHGTDQRRDEQNVQKMSNPRPRPKPQGSEDVDSRAARNLPRQQMTALKHLDNEENRGRQFEQQHFGRLMDDNSFPPPGNQVQVEKHSLETVYEEGTLDGTLNKSMTETKLELEINETMPHGTLASHQRGVSTTPFESHGSANAGLNFDQDGRTKHGYAQEQRGSEIRAEISAYPRDSEGHWRKERLDITDNTAGLTSDRNAQQQFDRKERQAKSREENADAQMHPEGTSQEQENKQSADGVTAKLTLAEEMTLPDPYQLLIRQEAQLRELQEQVQDFRMGVSNISNNNSLKKKT